MSNEGKRITNGYCNGYFGRTYDLYGAIVEAEGDDWVVIRTDEGEAMFAEFDDEEDKNSMLDEWTKGF